VQKGFEQRQHRRPEAERRKQIDAIGIRSDPLTNL
jgi:hypothetical protein